MKSAFRFARNAGLPIVRQPRKEGDHDIMTPRLRLIETPVERVFGSKEFIARTRRPDLVPPKRFEPSKRVAEDDVWL